MTGFTIIWQTENVNFCRAHKEYIQSPQFSIWFMPKLKWILRMDILRKNKDIDSLRVTLKRMDNETKIVTLNIRMLIVMPGQPDPQLGQVAYTSFSKDKELSFSTSHLDYKISELFQGNMLTISCNIFMPLEESIFSEKCFARTRVGVTRVCKTWLIENFSSNQKTAGNSYYLANPKNYLTFRRINWLPNGFLSIEIGRLKAVNNKMLQVFGKVCVFGYDLSIKFSEEDSYCFSSDDDIWNIQIPVSKSTIQRSGALDLLKDTLILSCDIIFFTEDTSEFVECLWTASPCESLFENKTKIETYQEKSVIKSSELKDDFKKLYKNRSHSDIVLCAGNLSIPCHKAILCARSPVFKAMFDSKMKENLTKKVEISDLDGDTLHRLILYAYSETLEQMDWEIAKKLLYAANKYEMKSLMNECSSFLTSHLTTSNICEALELADMYQNHGLQVACQDLIFKHANEVFASNVWKEFAVKHPLLSAETLQKYFSSKT